MPIKMKQSLHLTIEKELYSLLKIKRVNVSRYVEKLISKDLAKNSLAITFGLGPDDPGSNPGSPTFLSLL
jgi:hypothetical protein